MQVNDVFQGGRSFYFLYLMVAAVWRYLGSSHLQHRDQTLLSAGIQQDNSSQRAQPAAQPTS